MDPIKFGSLGLDLVDFLGRHGGEHSIQSVVTVHEVLLAHV
jgi:hypothetical protein